MDVVDFKKRGQELVKAHGILSDQITALLDQRIKIVGAIEENKYILKQLEKEDGNSSHKPSR
jgi:hypothetical protein